MDETQTPETIPQPPPPTDAETINGLKSGLATAMETANGAYRERNRCVAAIARAALALGLRAWLGKHPEDDTAWEPDWRNIVFVLLPEGQVSWHIHDSELPDFAFLAGFPGEPYDGHSTPEKYERLAAWAPARRG